MNSFIKIKNLNVEGFNVNAGRGGIKKNLINIFNTKEKKLNSDKKIKILKNINFEAKKGDRIGILGANGCGKTSLLRVIIGTYPPVSGVIEKNGTIVSMVGCGAEFMHTLDAIDNIKLLMIYTNRYHEYSEELLEKILLFAELEEQRNIPLYQYSSGMLARLSFAANIFQSGNILITDEVFATGDSRFIHKSRDKMKDLWNKVDIAITVSHDIEDIKELCTTCYVMQKGEIIYYGATEDAIKFFDKNYTNNTNAHR